MIQYKKYKLKLNMRIFFEPVKYHVWIYYLFVSKETAKKIYDWIRIKYIPDATLDRWLMTNQFYFHDDRFN